MKKRLLKSNKMYIRTIYLLIITCMMTAFSMAKYQSIYTSSGVASIATWSIKVNDVDLTGEGTTLTNKIELKPDETSNVVSGKLAPGYGGYFDIALNPVGTEVSFNYNLKLDNSNLPADIEIVGYTIGTSGTSENATPIVDNTITGTMSLTNNTAFSSSDTQNIRIFWIWNDVRSKDAVHTSAATSGTDYAVGVEVIVTQIIE